MAPKVAFIGLGNMGRGMCTNIVEKGPLQLPLIIYNRSVKRAEDFQKTLPAGTCRIAASIQEAVSEADIIWTCLGGDSSVEETITESLKVDVKGKVFIDSTTIHPDTTDSITKRIEAKGADFVACPVFGAVAMADLGQLINVLAGSTEAVDRVKPFCLGVTAKANIDLSGKPPSRAHLLKIIGNTFVLTMVESLAEGHTLALLSGLGHEDLHKFVETLFPGPYSAYSGRLLAGDYFKRDEPLMSVDWARKDCKHAMDIAKACGTRMKNVETVDDHLAKIKAYMGSKGDLAGIYGAVRQEAGLKFEEE